MLVGLSGYLAGYNGSFEFKSGEKYPEELNYTFMRAFNAFFGAVCIPLAYYTARELNFKRPAVWFVTLMVLCENSYTTISRFILLDSMLLCFTFTTVLCWARFHRLQNKSFSAEWFAWLFLTGLSIGCVCSVKWVGMFGTALVGLYTIEDLWNKFGDVKMPKVDSGCCSMKNATDIILGHSCRSLRLKSCWLDRRTFDRVYALLCCALCHLGEQWPWRCPDELLIPGQS